MYAAKYFKKIKLIEKYLYLLASAVDSIIFFFFATSLNNFLVSHDNISKQQQLTMLGNYFNKSEPSLILYRLNSETVTLNR